MLPGRKAFKPTFFLIIGALLTVTSLIALLIIFYPIIKSELGFLFFRPDPNAQVGTFDYIDTGNKEKKNIIVVKDREFGVVVPKIGANAKVIPDVDPENSRQYQVALSQGVAHAKGTSYPDKPGNTFLFAHSSDSFLNANTYNAVFYLLNKIETGDHFYIAYRDQLYKYEVVKTDIIFPSDTRYYGKVIPDTVFTATLMTCWPPATTLKRLVVVGKLQ